MHRFFQSIGWKLILWEALIILVATFGLSEVYSRVSMRQMLRNKTAETEQLAEVVRLVTRTAMLRNTREDVQETISTIARHKNILRARVIDHNGAVRVSSAPEEIGFKFAKTDPTCIECHIGKEPGAESRTRTSSRVVAGQGKRALGFVLPIYNEEECHTCHDPQNQRVLGLLDIENSLEEVDAVVAKNRRLIFMIGIVTFVLISSAIGIIIEGSLIVPLRKMISWVRQLAAGNYDARMEITSKGEIGELASHFADMAQSIQHAVKELEASNSMLSCLNRISNEFRTIHDVDKMLYYIPIRAHRCFHFYKAAIFKVDDQREMTTLYSAVGFNKAARLSAEIELFRNGSDGALSRCLLERRPVAVALWSTALPTDEKTLMEKLEVDFAAATPLNYHQKLLCWEYKNCRNKSCPAHGREDVWCWQVTKTFDEPKGRQECIKCPVFRTHGILFVANKRGAGAVTQEQLDTLAAYANMASLALENAHLYEGLESEVKERTQELEAVNERLRKYDQIKSEFVRKAAHELRSPISAVQSRVKFVLEGLAGNITDLQREMLDKAEQRSSGLIQLIRDLLDISRIEAGEIRKNLAPVDVGEILARSVDFFKPRADEGGLELKCDIAVGLPPVMAEKDSMESVLTNLINNAIKYTPAGGKVSVSAAEQEGYVVVKVADTGIGIPENEQQNVFHEFFRSDNAKALRQDGTGLGLSIVKRIVESYNGNVSFTSRVEKGTEFVVRFPPHASEVTRA